MEDRGKYEKAGECAFRRIAGEGVLVPIRQGVGDLESIYTLNEVGASVWVLIDGENSVGQIVEAVCQEYEVPREQAQGDVGEFLSALAGEGLIRPFPSPGT